MDEKRIANESDVVVQKYPRESVMVDKGFPSSPTVVELGFPYRHSVFEQRFNTGLGRSSKSSRIKSLRLRTGYFRHMLPVS